MSTWQRYTDEVSLKRLAAGACPECGHPPGEHSGWGGPNCMLTDTGVAGRIWQYQEDLVKGAPKDEPQKILYFVYTPMGTGHNGGSVSTVACGECGALVDQIALHTRFHGFTLSRTVRNWSEIPKDPCPDGGACHHHCTFGCFRVAHASPLSGVFPDDVWSVEVTTQFSQHDGRL